MRIGFLLIFLVGGRAAMAAEPTHAPASAPKRYTMPERSEVSGYRAGQFSWRTANFLVTAPTQALAKEIAETAERHRKALALLWIGKELPAFEQPLVMRVGVGNFGAGGTTSFVFDRGRVFGFQTEIQGTRERILDSVLPHEILHTVLAQHFKRPVPRWADEGACTSVECQVEREKSAEHLQHFIASRRTTSLDSLFHQVHYPNDVLPLYAQGHSVVEFLVSKKDHAKFLDFIGDALESDNYDQAVKKHYGYESVAALEKDWLFTLDESARVERLLKQKEIANMK